MRNENETCICTYIYEPWCGVDGESYGNKCALDCAGVKGACQGECPCVVGGLTEEELVVNGNVTDIDETNGDDYEVECMCTLEWNPWCGMDGSTHRNRCALDCAGVEPQCQGDCPCKLEY